MQRVIILGRGGSGKSTTARRLSQLTGLPVIELDQHFWQPGLVPLPKERWIEIQQELAGRPRWIMDGDLGPHDALQVRLAASDTALLLDFPLSLCLWRSLRRSRESWAFWRWLITWRRLERPNILRMLARHPNAKLRTFGSPRELDLFLSGLAPAARTDG